MYVLAGIILLLYLFRFTRTLTTLAYFGAFSTIFYFIGGLLAMRAQLRAARYYTLSWFMFALGACIYALRDVGVLPFTQFTTLSAQAGNLLECALLSFALADRINILQKEKEMAQREAVRMAERAKEELEVKVIERTLELNEQKNRAEQATKLKDKFVTLVSHDLRSPLTSQMVGLNLLKEDTSLNIKNREFVGKLASHCNAQITLIDRLLDISRLQTGKLVLNKRYISLNRIFEECIGLLQALAEQKKITINNTFPTKVRLYADPTLFGECIKNVLSNAIKFCREGDSITIFAPEGRPTTVGIMDTGIGIEPALIRNLFKHDIKTTSVGTQGEKGTGLGLPYCNDIMQAHGGAISVESEPGKGSTFFLSLPECKPIILAIDDQPAQLSILGNILAPLGATVITAENGREALEILNEVIPRLIITDLNMPVMDGMAFITAVRRNPVFKNIPIVAVTSKNGHDAKTEIALKELLFSIGANDFVAKPDLATDLLPRLSRLLTVA